MAEDPRIQTIRKLLLKKKFTRVRREALKLGGDDPNFLSSVAIILAMANQTSSAVHLLKKAREIDPEDPLVLTRLGTVQERMKRVGDAEKSYRKAGVKFRR